MVIMISLKYIKKINKEDLDVDTFKKCIMSLSLIIFISSLLFTQQVFAFTTQGIVTGRMYDELGNSSNSTLKEFYDMKLGWIRIEFEEFYGVPSGSNFNSPEVQANKVKFQNVINNAHAKGLKVLGVIAYSAFPVTLDFPNTIIFIKSELS